MAQPLDTVRDGSSPTSADGWTAARVFWLVVLVFGTEYSFMAYAFPPGVLGPIAAELKTTQAVWVIAAFLIGAAAVTPLLGRLGDLYGKRRILVLMLALSAVGGFVCAVAPNFGVLVAGRALQGLALGTPFMSASLARDLFPERIRSLAIALVVTGGGALAVLASLALGPIIVHLGWRGVFWIPAAYAVVITVLVLVGVPESPVRSAAGSMDVAGALLLAGGVTALLIPVSLGSEWGWSSPATLGFLAAGVVVLGIWVAQALRTRNPVIALREFRHPPLLAAFGLAAVGIGVIPFVFSLWSYVVAAAPVDGLGYGLGMHPESISLFSAVFSLGSLVGGFASGYALRRVSPGIVAAATFALGAGGYLAAAFSLSSPVAFGLSVLLMSLGSGGGYAIVYNLVAAVVRPERQASTAGAVTLGTNIVGAIYPVVMFAALHAAAVVTPAGVTYGLTGMRTAFLVSALLLLVMAGLGLGLAAFGRHRGGDLRPAHH